MLRTKNKITQRKRKIPTWTKGKRKKNLKVHIENPPFFHGYIVIQRCISFLECIKKSEGFTQYIYNNVVYEKRGRKKKKNSYRDYIEKEDESEETFASTT